VTPISQASFFFCLFGGTYRTALQQTLKMSTAFSKTIITRDFVTSWLVAWLKPDGSSPCSKKPFKYWCALRIRSKYFFQRIPLQHLANSSHEGSDPQFMNLRSVSRAYTWGINSMNWWGTMLPAAWHFICNPVTSLDELVDYSTVTLSGIVDCLARTE
jgi:hypothetical protein